VAFADFAFPHVPQALGLMLEEADLFSLVPAVSLREDFIATLTDGATIALAVNTAPHAPNQTQCAISGWTNTIEPFPTHQSGCDIDGKLYLHDMIFPCSLQRFSPSGSVLRTLCKKLSFQSVGTRFKLASPH